MITLKTVCLCVLLLSCSLFILDATYIMHQEVDKEDARLQETHKQLDASIEKIRFSADSIGALSGLLRSTATSQQKYYDIAGKNVAESSAEFYRVMVDLDAGIQYVYNSTVNLEVSTMREQQKVGDEAVIRLQATQKPLDALTQAIQSYQTVADHADVTLNGPIVKDSEATMLLALKHLDDSSMNVEAATNSIKELLSPKKKGFWMRVLPLLIPRPNFQVP